MPPNILFIQTAPSLAVAMQYFTIWQPGSSICKEDWTLTLEIQLWNTLYKIYSFYLIFLFHQSDLQRIGSLVDFGSDPIACLLRYEILLRAVRDSLLKFFREWAGTVFRFVQVSCGAWWGGFSFVSCLKRERKKQDNRGDFGQRRRKARRKWLHGIQGHPVFLGYLIC